MRRSPTVSLAMLVVLGGCAVGPGYQTPAAPTPAAFSSGETAPAPPIGDWWKRFSDPVLDDLIARALASGPDVQQALARVREAREQESVTRGGHGLQANASAQGAETHLSKNALPSGLASLFSGSPGQGSSSPAIGVPGETFSVWQAGFDASWEIDLFGGQRRQDEAARARTQASVWSARDAQVVLAAEVANTYEQYRTLQRRLVLADEAVSIARETAAYVAVRAKSGLVPASDAARQARQADEAAALREDLAAQSQVHVHALATLLGLVPDALVAELRSLPADGPAAPAVPAGLPSQLLERRPDIRAAERAMAAATADAGVATADLYPKLSLTGAVDLASRSLTRLLESDSLQDNIGGRISVPLLGRGRLHAAVRVRQAQRDEAAIAYRKAVVSALRDVEDALARLQADRRRAEVLGAAVDAARDASEDAAVRYRNGLTVATDLLAARDALRSARDAATQAQTSTTADVVALYKALGGGWDERRAPIDEELAVDHAH
ncbi:MAG TPA: efflux transporter outer membrane subunit [Caulobacteraceae bacterium]|jgi:NodT family efflux transporter outer membrane factor (OMF) lipoprotein|nr:efflux transporter outer membrane subunit [Caulobacteraceae bacterium]